MKKALFLLLLFTGFIVHAQNTATLNLTASRKGPAIATLILEDVHFYPNLGTGLTDTRLETVASVNFNEKTSEKAVAKLNEPKIMRLQYSGNGVNKTWMLFVQPGDELNVNFSDNADVSFSGKNAAYQNFLKSYFLENQFQYLPVRLQAFADR